MTTELLSYFKAKGITINADKCIIVRGDQSIKVEPMVMELLMLLMTHANQVVNKNHIMEKIWPNKYVNDEALTKLVSKLRKALGDDPKLPTFIKTTPKKGYELLIDDNLTLTANTPINVTRRWPIIVAGAMGLLAMAILFGWQGNKKTNGSGQTATSDHIERLYKRANSHYYQYSKAENQSALHLYQNIIANDPDHALSQSGMANALVQQLIRWPQDGRQSNTPHVGLLPSIAEGRLSTPQAVQQLNRAQGLAIRATELAPDNAIAHRSLGLVYAAQQQFSMAEKHYLKAISLDPNEWGAMINLSDIYHHHNNHDAALDILKSAHTAMGRVYDEQEVIVRPWYHKLAIVIAEKSVEQGLFSDAEITYRQILNAEPYNQQAVIGLSKILKHHGDAEGADRLCQQWSTTMQQSIDC